MNSALSVSADRAFLFVVPSLVSNLNWSDSVAEHISRKDLKRDEVAETLAHGAEAVISHQRTAWLIGGAVLAVLLAVFGWRFYSDRQSTKASADLEKAMETFNARIRQPNEPEPPSSPTPEVTYVDAKNKYDDAAKQFGEVAEKYPRTRPGQVAQYYAALSYQKNGRLDEAQQWLRKAESGSPDIAALARFQLAQVLAQSGKSDEAVKIYQELMEKPATFVPKPVVMLALADQYRASNPAEAVKLYEQIEKDYDRTAAADEAKKRLEMMPKS